MRPCAQAQERQLVECLSISSKTVSHVFAGRGDKVNSKQAQWEHDMLCLDQAESSTAHALFSVSNCAIRIDHI